MSNFNSIKFNNIDTYEDWGLLLKPRSPSKPSPKTTIVDIPGGDGSLDLSEAVSGEIKFKDLTLTYDFTMVDSIYEWDEKYRKIANYLHGRNMKIVESWDSDYYYYGRCEVDKFTPNKALGEFAIKCTVRPYKLKHEETVVEVSLEDENNRTIHITNDRKSVIPTIICTEETMITFNGNTFSLGAGTHQVLDIQFVEGRNTLELFGTGKVTFKFQEGTL